jgi:hypothetical protein
MWRAALNSFKVKAGGIFLTVGISQAGKDLLRGRKGKKEAKA